MVTTISISSGVGNDGEVTMLNFARFVLLKQVNIGTNALNGVTKISTKVLPYFEEININQGSMKSIQEYKQ